MPPANPRRILSLWLPCLATDRLRRRLGTDPGRPLVAVAAERGRLTVAAADRLAQAAGVGPGLPLADARALEPGLAVADADPGGDSAALGRLCDWAQRYTPVTAIDPAEQVVLGAGGLWLDVTGCAHLFGGEAGLLEDLALRLERAGLESRAAIADTAGAAWALARFGGPEPWPLIAPPGGQGMLLASLPVAALRLPAITVSGLKRVGLRRVGDLMGVPRAALAGRYGPLVAQRLDQALGTAEEALSPRRAVPPHVARLAFAEPVSTPEDMRRCLQHLLAQACRGLEAAGQGARRLVLSAWRVDGGIDSPPQLLEAGTSRPNRDPAHLLRLFEPRLDTLEPGPGFEVMALAVPAADDCRPEQASLPPAALKPPTPPANVVRFPGRGRPLPGEREGPAAEGHGRVRETGSSARGGLPSVPMPTSLTWPLARPPSPQGEGKEADLNALPWTGPLRAAKPVRVRRVSLAPPVPELVDQVGARLGLARVRRPLPRESWWPERAVDLRPADAPADKGDNPAGDPRPWPADRPRPIRLLRRPEPIQVTAMVPDAPPASFTWRGTPYRVRVAEGPERLSPEWWRRLEEPEAALRDYYRVEEQGGRRFWLYRLGLFDDPVPPTWYLHGVWG